MSNFDILAKTTWPQMEEDNIKSIQLEAFKQRWLHKFMATKCNTKYKYYSNGSAIIHFIIIVLSGMSIYFNEMWVGIVNVILTSLNYILQKYKEGKKYQISSSKHNEYFRKYDNLVMIISNQLSLINRMNYEEFVASITKKMNLYSKYTNFISEDAYHELKKELASRNIVIDDTLSKFAQIQCAANDKLLGFYRDCMEK